jgi:hypothetical protein
VISGQDADRTLLLCNSICQPQKLQCVHDPSTSAGTIQQPEHSSLTGRVADLSVLQVRTQPEPLLSLAVLLAALSCGMMASREPTQTCCPITMEAWEKGHALQDPDSFQSVCDEPQWRRAAFVNATRPGTPCSRLKTWDTGRLLSSVGMVFSGTSELGVLEGGASESVRVHLIHVDVRQRTLHVAECPGVPAVLQRV